MRRYEVRLISGGVVLHRATLEDRPLSIGRGPGNDLVLIDEQVSWNHAVVWSDGEQVCIRDLGSTNGSFLDEQPLKDVAVLTPENTLRLGRNVQLQIGVLEQAQQGGFRRLMLEDLDAGVRFSLNSDRFVVGSAADADLRLPDGPERACVLMIHAPDEVWLGKDLSERRLAVGETFAAAERRLRLIEVASERELTIQAEEDRYPYRLAATLDGATGPEASLTELHNNRSLVVRAPNRSVLLYLLGKRLVEDRDAGRPAPESGWCSDDEMRLGIWGNSGLSRADSQFHVLVFRLRKQLEDKGFDPWFIEKRNRYIRARLREVEVS